MSEPCIASPAEPLAGDRPAQPVSAEAQPPARSAEAAPAVHAGAAQAAQAEAVARERWLFRHAIGAGQVHPLRHLLKRYRAGESS
jgi:hypothetical protein